MAAHNVRLHIVPALLVLLVFSCTDNQAVRKRYEAEKMYFLAERATRNAQIRPDLNTPGVSEQLRDNYRNVLEFCYSSLDSVPVEQFPAENSELIGIALEAATRLSQLSYADRQFDTSIAVLNRFLARAGVSGPAAVSTYLNLGRVLQAAGQWDSALAVYEYCIGNFYPPTDPDGEIIDNLFGLPIHILNIYTLVRDSIAAAIQVDQAELYYRSLIEDFPGSSLPGAAHSSLTTLYERAGRWKEAIDELSHLTDSAGNVIVAASQRIADIHARYLGKPDLAIDRYDDLLARLTDADTAGRPAILFKKGTVYLDKKEYTAARQIFNNLKNRFPRFFSSTPAVQAAIARSFELEGRWERAETEYKYLLERYPDFDEAMSVHLYLAYQQTQRGHQLEAERTRQRAEAEYDRIAASYPGTVREARALHYKAELYRRQADWPTTVEILADISEKFPGSEIGYQSIVNASVIYREKLNNSLTADSLLAELKKRLTAVDAATEF